MKNKTYCIAFMMCWIANKIVTNIHRLLIGFYQGILSGFRVTFILTESISGFVSTTLFTLVASIECILTNHGIVECLLEYTARDEIKCHADIIFHTNKSKICVMSFMLTVLILKLEQEIISRTYLLVCKLSVRLPREL